MRDELCPGVTRAPADRVADAVRPEAVVHQGSAIIVFSYHCAPAAAVGGKRFTFLAEQFERRGHPVRIVTGTLRSDDERDDSLPVPSGVVACSPSVSLPLRGSGALHKAANRVLRSTLRPVGLEISWAWPAAREATRAARPLGRGVIIGTLPPPAAGVGAALTAARLRWPLILDYRDPWTAYPWGDARRRRWSSTVGRRLEAWCVARSRARVFNTPEMRDEFERSFPAVDRRDHYVIPNGIDLADGDQALSGGLVEVRPEIVYAGEFYGQRSLLPILRSIASLRVTHARQAQLKLVVYGRVPPGELDAVRRAGLEGMLEIRGRVPRGELLRLLRGAAALLAMPSAAMNYSLPYKLYDYLGAGRPILAIAPRESALRRFVEQFGVGLHADPSDELALTKAMATALELDAHGAAHAAVEAHRWSRLADDYLELIRRVAALPAP